MDPQQLACYSCSRKIQSNLEVTRPSDLLRIQTQSNEVGPISLVPRVWPLPVELADDFAMDTCSIHYATIAFASWRVIDCTFKLAGHHSRFYVCVALRSGEVFFILVVDATLAKLLCVERLANLLRSVRSAAGGPLCNP
jgi:hypothetical protein